MGVALELPGLHRQHRLGPIERLDLRLLVAAGVRRLPGCCLLIGERHLEVSDLASFSLAVED